ncbi:hypothetical protein ON010_g8629 [Phytophthora cinnamomi]|nr:hypothetical protein ON010_g8629 [Phytophthora cinnamomi]
MEEEIQESASAWETDSPRSARAPRASVKAQSRLGRGPFRSRSPTRRADTVAAIRGLRGAPQIGARGTSAQRYRDPFRSPSPRRGRPLEQSQPEQELAGERSDTPAGGGGGAPSAPPDGPGGPGGPGGGGGSPPPAPDPAGPGGHSPEDEEMPDVSEQGRVANAPALPRAPQYKGRTMAERRDFMRAYQSYYFALSAYETAFNRPYVLPVKHCIEARTLRRICYYELEIPVESVTEEMLVKYFLDARVPESDDDWDMKNLKMDTSFPDAASRVEKLIDDMEIVLIKHNMDVVIRVQEPKKLVSYLVAALAPPAFKQAVQRKLSQEQYKAYKKDVVRFSKWIRELLRGFIVWGEQSGEAAASAAKAKEQQKNGSQSSAGAGTAKGSRNDRGQQKPQQPKPPREKPQGSTGGSAPTKGFHATVHPCLKCHSQDHRVKECPMASESEAKELISSWRAQQREIREKSMKMKKISVIPPEEGKLAEERAHKALVNVGDDGCVPATVDAISVLAALVDSGADDSVVSLGVIRELENSGQFVQLARAEGELLPFGDRTLSVSRRALFNEVLLETSAGPLRLRNLQCWVFEEDETKSLAIGRPVMQKLGYTTDGFLVKALRTRSEWDLASADQDVGTSSTTTAAKAGGSDSGRDGLLHERKPELVRMQQLRELVRLDPGLQGDGMGAAEDADFRTATPILSRDKAKASEEVHKALQAGIEDAYGHGLPPAAAKELRHIVFQHEDVFRLEFGGDPPLKVPPMQVRLKPGAQPVKCRARRYPPLHREFLERHVDELVKAGLLYENHRSRWASPALVVPKKAGEFRMVVDDKGVNKCTDPMTWPMPNIEVALSSLEGSEYYFVLDWFRGYWQLLLALACQEMFTIMTHKGMYTPTRVPMGATDSVAHCQGAVEQVFGDLMYHGILAWLDDILGYEDSVKGLLCLLEKVLKRCAEFGLKLHPKKCRFFARKVKWCGRLISGGGISHCPERVAGLVEMHMPKTAADLQQLLCAINWMRSSIPGYAIERRRSWLAFC